MGTILDKYDSISERLPDDSTFEQRLEKFTNIVGKLNEHGIHMTGSNGHVVDVEDPSCGFKLGHGKTSWDIFRVDDVVDMIVNMRNDYIERSKLWY